MKRNLLLLAVMIVAMLFASHSWAQCPQDPIDLGICDTLYVETFDCDHTYEGTGGYDSVRLAIYVTHDSNTFWWEGGQRFVQDSISGFVIPLKWWPSGCADSIVFPTYLNWNGKFTNRLQHQWKRSIFRDITCPSTGEVDSNIFSIMTDLGWDPWTHNVNFKGDSCMMASIAPGTGKWWEGSKMLYATVTFLVYGLGPDPDCDSADICVDSTFWPPSSNLAFTRYDAVNYIPRHFLPVCDTIYVVPCLPPQITCPGAETQGCNGTYTTTTKWSANAGASPGIVLTAVNICGTLPPGITGATVNVDPPGLPAATATGTVTYTVGDHSAAGGAICVMATNSCAPPLTAQCTFNVSLTNVAPTITCPPNVSGPYNVNMVSGNFTATDECPGVVPTVEITNVTGGPCHAPTIVGNHVEWFPDTCDCNSPITVELTATDDDHATASCSFTMTSTNQAPTVICPPDLEQYWDNGPPLVSGNFTANDPEGDIASITVDAGTFNDPQIVGSHVEWLPTEEEICSTFTFTITVTDACGLTASCDFTMHAKEVTGYVNAAIIPNKVYERFHFGHWDYFPWDGNGEDNYIILDDVCPPYNGVNPGDFIEIPIILQGLGASSPDSIFIGGFEIEVDFDYIDLTFYGADRGGLLSMRWYEPYDPNPTDSVLWSWEYFTYRVLPCVTCACCKYKIELYGQGEMPDGQLRRGYYLGEKFGPQDDRHAWWYVDSTQDGQPIGATLAWLKFQVANNELLRDLKLPIVFEWEHKLNNTWPYYIIQDWDCAENSMSDSTGYFLYVSGDSMQYMPGVCPVTLYNLLKFVDGGVHVCSPCTAFTCVRGDINMNKIAYEVADAVLFARYFIYGVNVFTIDRNKQICATDANADGRTLMLADLIYLIRVIQKDAVPFPKLGPSSDVANLIISDGNITVECAASVGGLLFEFDGSVNATLLNTDMEMLSNEGKVLVWSSAGNSINAGASQILNVSGANLTSVVAVDREGRELATTITTKLAPSTFALHSAYPNPFNPSTNLSFTLPTATPYSMNIYNVAGQLVRTYEGMGNVGLNVITWNGKDNAGNEVSSGVYFYKLIAGSFTATNKMVMMK